VKLTDLLPGWRTDFILHRFDADVREHADCIAVRTPDNPSYYWGNCLILPRSPADGDHAHWLARFDELIAQTVPGVLHVAIGVNEGGDRRVPLPTWESGGFDLIDTCVMMIEPGQLLPPARAPRGEVEVREVQGDDEWATLLELQCADPHGFEPVAYRAHRVQQLGRFRRMQAKGIATWFGVWCDGVMAADCGLMRDGDLGRFQHVSTHPGWRRRGLCSALVQAVVRHGFERWGLARLCMCADPDDVAIDIYRSLGFRPRDSEWCMQRYAPHDTKGARTADQNAGHDN